MTFIANPLRDPAWRPEPGLEPQARALHESLPGYAPTPLHSLPSLAEELGLGRVLLKDESSRFGLPAFKALGAFWAAHWAVEQSGRDTASLTLVAATEGNHGRAVARAASLLGARARIVIPAHTAPARADAIAAEGALVERIDGGYEDAVAHAAFERESRGDGNGDVRAHRRLSARGILRASPKGVGSSCG